MTRLNTEFVETKNTGKLDVGDVVEFVNVGEFHEGVKIGQRALVIQMVNKLFFKFAVLAYEVEGLDHLVFRNIDYRDFEDEVKFLGRQTDAHKFQKQFISDLGAHEIQVIRADEHFDTEYVEDGEKYPIVGTALKPIVEWLEQDEDGGGTVAKVTGWQEKYSTKVVVFGVRDGYTQSTELDDHVKLALAS